MIVLIDNGHGRETPGKRSPIWADGSQLFEWEFNRNVAQRIHNGFESFGIPSKLLVPEIYDVPRYERVKRANDIFKVDKSAIGLSIHGNAFKGRPTDACGWEAWTSIGETLSDLIAEYLYLEAEQRLPMKFRKDTRDGDSDKESRFDMVHLTDCPFVLTENGFMDNQVDCRYMMSEKGRQEIANVHVYGILKFIVANTKI